MKDWTRVPVMMLIGLLATVGLHARSGGSISGGGPGGHGGSGGHGGRGGVSSARGVGHAIGHSFGNLFGRHSKAAGSVHDMVPPLAGATVLHGRVMQLPGPEIVSAPARTTFHRQSIHEFPFSDRFLFFRPRPGFGFGGCADFGFPRHHFSLDNDFNCSAEGFFFDPFFIAGFSWPLTGSPALLPFNDQRLDYVSDDSTAAPPPEVSRVQPHGAADLSKSGSSTENAARNNAASGDKAKNEQPVTLLQLYDGSMYGLVDYWVEDGQLYYTTTYAGQGSVGLDRIDLEKTVQLNAGRGVQFVLHPKTPSR